MSNIDQVGSICAVVVTRNRLSLLQECIDAIRSQTRPASRILVVDNDSSDGTTEWLSQQVDISTVFQENLGGAGGFHRGMKEAVNAGWDHVWVMDDDVIAGPKSLERLCEAAAYVPKFGFLASTVVGADGGPVNVPSLERKLLSSGSPCWPELAGAGLLRIRSATFVSLLIPSAKIKSVGLPLKEMFIWGDDTEYTMRISEKAVSYWVLKSEVTHKRVNQKALSIVSESDPARINLFFFHCRNNLFVAIKYRDARLLLSNIASMLQASWCCVGKSYGLIKLKIMIKGALAALSFRPVIDSP